MVDRCMFLQAAECGSAVSREQKEFHEITGKREYIACSVKTEFNPSSFGKQITLSLVL
jgi:hypothetical protein